MAQEKDRFTVKAYFDKVSVKEDDVSVRYLVIDVETAEINERKRDKSLNLALVLDVSTSMRGARMANSKLAALALIDALDEEDYLSIVSFGETVRTELEAVKMNQLGKGAAQKTIEQLDHRIYTNLSGGWLQGAECVAQLMIPKPELHGHIVLLSDGYANRGILSSLVLQEHADQLRNRGVRTSTVGVGDDYSSTLLLKLAEYGGGRMHDAQHPPEIVEVIMGELTEILETFVQDISIELNFPVGVKVTNLCNFPDTIGSSSLIARIGSLPYKSSRRLVLRIEVPPKEKSSNLKFNCTVAGQNPETHKTIHLETSADLKYMNRRAAKKVERDEDICRLVAETWQASVVRTASDLNRAGEFTELKRYLDHELNYFTRYCEDIAGVEYLVTELSLLRKNADTDWQERLRKEMELTSYQYQTTTNDYRPFKRDKWSETMGEGF